MHETNVPTAEAALDVRVRRFVWAELPVASLSFSGDCVALARSRLIACIPACNEENWIERCLVALDADLSAGDGTIVLANGCEDATVPRALEVLRTFERPWLLVECQWHPSSGTAPFARRLALDVATGLAPDAILLSIDGDTVAMPGLATAYAAEFSHGYDLVCGRIGFLPEEAALLPPADPENEAIIREYREASREIAAAICPDPDNPWPNHGNIGGANFAMRGAAYRAGGHLPTPPSGEDRALRRRFEALGLRIRYADGPRVETSCRLLGRATGGLSDELRRNRSEHDPIVDELLEPPQTLLLRCRTRAAFLAPPSAEGRAALLAALGLGDMPLSDGAWAGGEAAWQAVEDASPRLRRTRLRLSDLRRHLPELRLALSAIRDARSDSPLRPAP